MKTLMHMTALLALLFFAGCENKKGAFIETVQCAHPVQESVNRFEKIIEKKGLSLFHVLDHAQNAKNAGLSLRPTTVVVFGSPKVGTPLMQCNQTMGLDLPLRMLFYTDFEGRHWLSYTNPEYYTLKHNIKDKKCLAIINNVSVALKALAEETADMNSSSATESTPDKDTENTAKEE